MEINKLNKIIERKNEKLENDALYAAERIIEQIASTQRNIDTLNEQIVELRKELISLQITQLDAATILGGE